MVPGRPRSREAPVPWFRLRDVRGKAKLWWTTAKRLTRVKGRRRGGRRKSNARGFLGAFKLDPPGDADRKNLRMRENLQRLTQRNGNFIVCKLKR